MAINKIAEVISTSSTEFTAQCYRLNHAPAFGALVKVGTSDNVVALGVVYNIETHSLEPGRRIMVRGDEMATEKEIYDVNPHLEKLLVTDFKALIIGYSEKKKMRYYLPSSPSPIHSFVFLCEEEEIKAFSQSLDFISSLLENKSQLSPDEVLAACLRYMSRYQEDKEAFLIRAGKELLWTLHGDVRRLNAILKRLEIGE